MKDRQLNGDAVRSREEGGPPIFHSWRQFYGIVLGFLVLFILLMVWFGTAFS